ncbi:class I SAM-dependent methyltransferase [Paenibacillus lentus]|uniref:Class I SAM-dependent methyltransferase n=1 Tax=Paenibacillus lentus TaxID=1338368 RepID=A0A3Q8SD59_9BACL|nr:class I SAM-dependent methyltransferase [Paenibacillus lentus]AZK47939.1 class I SAM-dependent methyltransferase [Paenibacillus lentus]
MEIFKQVPLYRYLALCNESGLKRTVLDCGAGGDSPPLSLFASYGYTTSGIELNIEQIQQANQFAEKRKQKLNIQQGDMRNLPLNDESFSFVYSYNSIFHMKKEDVKKALNEMKRVLQPHGLMFVNFLTLKDFRVGEGVDLGNNQYEQIEDDEPVIHSYYDYNEADLLFDELKLIYKEERVVERIYEGKKIRQGFIDYTQLSQLEIGK